MVHELFSCVGAVFWIHLLHIQVVALSVPLHRWFLWGVCTTPWPLASYCGSSNGVCSANSLDFRGGQTSRSTHATHSGSGPRWRSVNYSTMWVNVSSQLHHRWTKGAPIKVHWLCAYSSHMQCGSQLVNRGTIRLTFHYAIFFSIFYLASRELHGDKKSSPFPPRTQCINAATAIILLKLFPLPRLPRFYRGNQC